MARARWTGSPPSELLLVALFTPDAGPKAWRAWTDDADRYGCDSESARLLALAYRRRHRFGVDDDEPWVARAADRYRATWARNHTLLRAASVAADSLHRDGIPVMALKGAALVDRYYGDVGARPMLDVDLLVPAGQWPRAIEVLRSAGYAARSEPAVDFPYHAVELIDPAGREIDLHRSLFRDPMGDRDEGGRWQRSTPGTLAGSAVRDGHRADLLLHVIHHGTHRFRGGSVRWVPDALAILGAGDLDHDVFVELAAAEGLGPPAAAALDYLRALAGIEVDTRLLRRLRALDASWVTRRSFRAAPASGRWDVSRRMPAGIHTLAALIEQRGPRAGVVVARRMIRRSHGTARTWVRFRWRRWAGSPSPKVGDASIRRALGGGVGP